MYGFFAQKGMGYWVWQLWVLELIFPGMNMVDPKKYGLEQSMGFDKYGLFQSRLYFIILYCSGVEAPVPDSVKKEKKD